MNHNSFFYGKILFVFLTKGSSKQRFSKILNKNHLKRWIFFCRDDDISSLVFVRSAIIRSRKNRDQLLVVNSGPAFFFHLVRSDQDLQIVVLQNGQVLSQWKCTTISDVQNKNIHVFFEWVMTNEKVEFYNKIDKIIEKIIRSKFRSFGDVLVRTSGLRLDRNWYQLHG